MGCVRFFFVKQKTAYEMRISDWSSDVCASDLTRRTEFGLFRVLQARQRSEVVIHGSDNNDYAKGRLFWERIWGNGLKCGESVQNEPIRLGRSEERRVGNECVSACLSRWSPYHYKQKDTYNNK